MVKQILRNKDYLKSLIKTSPRNRKLLIKAATPDQLRSIFEATLNVANCNVPVNLKTRNKLRKFKGAIEKVAFAKGNKCKRKQILIQQGGFLPILLSSVLGFLANQLL